MKDLVGFLLARIAEDRAALELFDSHFDTDRWVAECDTKRRIIELVAPGAELPESLDGCEVLLPLALPYADHPDYLGEWRP